MWGRISSYQGNGDERKECKLNVGYSESKSGSNNCGSEKSPMTAASPLPMVKLRQCSHLVRVEHLQERWRRSITMTMPFAIRMFCDGHFYFRACLKRVLALYNPKKSKEMFAHKSRVILGPRGGKLVALFLVGWWQS